MCTCEKALELMNEAIDGCIADDARAQLQEHLSQCEDCRRAFEAYEAIQSGLLDLEEEPPERFAQGVMYRISKEGGKVKRFAFGKVTALCAAAALFLVLTATGTLKSIAHFGAKSAAPAAATAESNQMLFGASQAPKSANAAAPSEAYFYAADEAAPAEGVPEESGAEMPKLEMKSEAPAPEEAYEMPCNDIVEAGEPEAEEAAHACVLTIFCTGDPKETAALLADGAELTERADGIAFETTVAAVRVLLEREDYRMEIGWSSADPADDAPAEVVILEE